jgi:hypothetical protein
MKEVATKHGNLRAENSRKGYTSSDVPEKEFVSAGNASRAEILRIMAETKQFVRKANRIILLGARI